ncbi:DUF4465 domain-containing protein [Winogradskyella sp. F6397]|uniref:DUF4465 domain-containing protein n=1 Tax=Winogradskyella marina TaxID=2785530 RepID=A0ABS0EK08_9FLAO|nr:MULTISPECIES: DUF4465 domain-containing protein [Winogradskyella]MBF8150748.1 DUF4465 domain-containing protein [Winogradskyella marina]
MKFIPKYIVAIACIALFNACDDELEVRIPYPNDITFNEIELDRFTYEIYDAPFNVGNNASGVVTVNVSNPVGGNFSGFALSNKNFRSYPWSLSRDFAPEGGLTPSEVQQAIDSTAFSVYTDKVNRTENYLVGNTTGDNAYFTLVEPGIVEHVLVANTSYNYLLSSFGSIYSATYEPDTQAYLFDGQAVRNHQIANPNSNLFSAFSLPAPNNVEAVSLRGHNVLTKRAAGEAAGEVAEQAVLNAGGTEEEAEEAYDEAYSDAFDAVNTGYVKLIIEGYLNGSTTGNVEVYLAVRQEVDPENPEHGFILNDWRKVDLTSLGDVDKVVFKMTSSYVDDQGKMIYPNTFCLDGIRLQ